MRIERAPQRSSEGSAIFPARHHHHVGSSFLCKRKKQNPQAGRKGRPDCEPLSRPTKDDRP